MKIAHRRILLLDLLKIMDLLVMAVLVFIVTGLSGNTDSTTLQKLFTRHVSLSYLPAFFVFILVWHISFQVFGLYQSRRISSQVSRLLDVVKATTLGTAGILVVSVLFHVEDLSRRELVSFWLGAVSLSMLSRVVITFLQHTARLHGRNLRHVLIVGTNRRAIAIASAMESKPELGYRVIGFADDEWHGTGEVEKNGHQCVTSLTDLGSFIRENVVDEVIICLPIHSFYKFIRSSAELCADQGVITRLLIDLFDFDIRLNVVRTDYLEQFPLITLSGGGIDGWSAACKRGFDIVSASIAILLLSPVFLVTILLVKLTSKGPVFFKQSRLGLNKRPFPMYKFRTMVVNAEALMKQLEEKNEAGGPVFKLKNDPRITSVGRILRKLSIDELPQLLNVLKGDMSMVGPRPLPLRDYAGFDQDWYRRRFSVRPGISCLWQINGRSSIGFEEWMQLDMNYIDQWSFWLDMKILFKTIPAVLSGEGAY